MKYISQVFLQGKCEFLEEPVWVSIYGTKEYVQHYHLDYYSSDKKKMIASAVISNNFPHISDAAESEKEN